MLCVPLACGAAPEGRWEGPVAIPGNEVQVVIDLARDATGAWTGSIILQGLGVKGAPLANLSVRDADVAFDIGDRFRSPHHGPMAFTAHLIAADAMTGEMRQGGNVASFQLRRTASAQVERAPRSTAVGRDLADTWIGEFELGGYPRHVTLTLENHSGAAATGRFVIVGKQTTDIPVDLVTEDGNFLRVESLANRVAFEARYDKASGELRGVVELGFGELPLVLRRSGGRPS
jgi:hypothetical protein